MILSVEDGSGLGFHTARSGTRQPAVKIRSTVRSQDPYLYI